MSSGPSARSSSDSRGADLRRADLRSAYLIAANLQDADLRGADLLGTDLRDANVRGTDLTGTLFLTQTQVNAARGDEHTRIPASLRRPPHWRAGADGNTSESGPKR